MFLKTIAQIIIWAAIVSALLSGFFYAIGDKGNAGWLVLIAIVALVVGWRKREWLGL